MKTKNISQRVGVDTTLSPPVGSVSFKISPDVTPGGDRVAALDVEHVEDIDEDVKLFTPIGTKINRRKWVKKHESQVGEHNKLKLKVVVLYDGIGKKIHMAQLVWFIAADLVTIA